MSSSPPIDDARVTRVAVRASFGVALVTCAVLLVLFQARPLIVLRAGVRLALALRTSSAFVARKMRLPYGAALAIVTLTGLAAIVATLVGLGTGDGPAVRSARPAAAARVAELLDRIQANPALARALGPLLVRTTVRIPPAYTLAAQLLLGTIFGAMGLTFATPILIVATVLVKQPYLNRSSA